MADWLLDGTANDLHGLLEDQDQLALCHHAGQVLYTDHVEGFGLLTLRQRTNMYDASSFSVFTTCVEAAGIKRE